MLDPGCTVVDEALIEDLVQDFKGARMNYVQYMEDEQRRMTKVLMTRKERTSTTK